MATTRIADKLSRLEKRALSGKAEQAVILVEEDLEKPGEYWEALPDGSRVQWTEAELDALPKPRRGKINVIIVSKAR